MSALMFESQLNDKDSLKIFKKKSVRSYKVDGEKSLKSKKSHKSKHKNKDSDLVSDGASVPFG